MKARIKATGEIIEVRSKAMTSIFSGENILKYIDQHTGVSYFEDELFFPKDLNQDPDYWTRLEHQYAGMAMQGLMSYIEQITPSKGCSYCDTVVSFSFEVAHALVEKYKKEERK